MENYQEFINILVGLEPVFKKAGQLALSMRETAVRSNKFNTGIASVDIVTEADFAVQEMILTEIVKTELINCQLFAEEKTSLALQFKDSNGLVLSLDPIDGIAIYASTGRFFSVIVSLHDRQRMLYTFCYYPLINWARRITADGIFDEGNLLKVNVKEGIDLSKVIAYPVRGPKKIDSVIYNQLLAQGYEFLKASEITNEAGACTLLFLDQVAGYYQEGPNPYDGCVAWHYGEVKKFKIYKDLDISTYEPSERGPHYSGWYVVLRK